MTPPTSQVQSQQPVQSQPTLADHDTAGSAIAPPETSSNAQAQDQTEALKQTQPEKKQAKRDQEAKKQAAKQQAKKRGSKLQALKARFTKPRGSKAEATPPEGDPSPNTKAKTLEPSKHNFPNTEVKALSKRPKRIKSAKAPLPPSPPATSLNAHELVLGWFKAYPGLWLSPLALGILGGWVFAQPDSAATNSNTAISAEAAALPIEPQPSPFGNQNDAAFDPSYPFGGTDLEAAATTPDGQLLADPPGATALTQATLEQSALEQVAQAEAGASAPSAATGTLAAGLPGVPNADETSQANTSDSAKLPADLPTPEDSLQEKALAEQLAAQVSSTATVSSADQAQAAADAKFVLEERAKAQAAAFAQAQANQAASSTPPQPAPPIQGNPAVDQLITMQVAIAEGDTTLSMGGSNKSVVMTQAGEPLLQLEAGEYGMQCDGAGLVLNGQNLPATVMMAPLEGGLNYVRDRSYRGQIQFICQGNTVLAVNHIDMLNYLYSVVGSEVSPSWAPAALKAQSVAARSYALTYYFRPAKEHFHIGDTESYQVYKGTVSEDDRVKAAVQATAGEFISYEGGIVESLYAASDDIVMEAFQGGGMSQLGARDFAEQGYNYLQILGYYYPQTSLGRMVIEDGA